MPALLQYYVLLLHCADKLKSKKLKLLASTMKRSSPTCCCMTLTLCILAIVVATQLTIPANAQPDDVAPLPVCSRETQSKLTQLSLRNMALKRRCVDQNGGASAFPFDETPPTRTQLVRLSASTACLLVSKAVLRVVERECVLTAVRNGTIPLRATAETILKLSQDRKDPAKHPIPVDNEELQRRIQQRAQLNRDRDQDPIGFSFDLYPLAMQQYETQLTKVYTASSIVLLSSDLQILNDFRATTNETGSHAAAAAVAELTQSSSSASTPSSSSSSTSGDDSSDSTDSNQGSGSRNGRGSIRAVTTKRPQHAPGSVSGATTTAAPPSTAIPSSAAVRIAWRNATLVVTVVLALWLEY